MQIAPDSTGAALLRKECRRFALYLIGEAPDSYVLEQYVKLHEATLSGKVAATAADEVLLRAAESSLLGLRCADAYARMFRPSCLLRRKLILAFAVLENSRAFHAHFTSGSNLSTAAALLRIAVSVAGFCAALLASLILIAPRTLLATGLRSQDDR